MRSEGGAAKPDGDAGSLPYRLLIAANRWIVKPAMLSAPNAQDLRGRFEKSARRVFHAPPLTCITDTRLVPELAALRVRCRPAERPLRSRKIILYFHGGAFIAGSPNTHSAMLARLSRMTRSEVILPFISLAPEVAFPQVHDEAWAAFQALIARGYAPGDIMLGGDSSGGNIALVLLARLLAEGVRPAGLFSFSPLTDLTFSGASVTENAREDASLPAMKTDKIGELYLQGADPKDPRASPLFAAFPNPPPVYLQVSRSEIVFDDSMRLADRLEQAGGRVKLDIWDDAPHVFVLFENRIREARQALKSAGRWINGRFGPYE